MGVLSEVSKFFTKQAVEPIVAVGNVFDKLFTSDEEKITLETAKLRLAQEPMIAQNEINKVQASHRSMFVAGARSFLMWVCGVGLAMAFIVNPMIEFIAPGSESINVPIDAMMELVLAMLGLAGMRTVEKINGVSK